MIAGTRVHLDNVPVPSGEINGMPLHTIITKDGGALDWGEDVTIPIAWTAHGHDYVFNQSLTMPEPPPGVVAGGAGDDGTVVEVFSDGSLRVQWDYSGTSIVPESDVSEI
jgi:hypothetical protein